MAARAAPTDGSRRLHGAGLLGRARHGADPHRLERLLARELEERELEERARDFNRRLPASCPSATPPARRAPASSRSSPWRSHEGHSPSSSSSSSGSPPRAMPRASGAPQAEPESARSQAVPVADTTGAVCSVIHEMLEMKYGLVLDFEDLMKKVELHCSGSALWPAAVVAKLNEQPDLHFRASDGKRLVSLLVECRSVGSYEELRREVGRMPGTARAAAVVSCSGACGETASTAPQLQAVAVFRQRYGRPELLVGRSCRNLARPAPALVEVHACGFWCGLVLDPQVSRELRLAASGLSEVPPPPLREEYALLGAWLISSEAPLEPPRDGDIGHAGIRPWSVVSAEALEAVPAATPGHLLRLRRALEHPDAHGPQVLQLLQQLEAWFAPTTDRRLHPQLAQSARSAAVPRGPLACVRRAAAPCAGQPERVACTRALRVLCLPLLLAVGAPFAGCKAVAAVCAAMRRWPRSAELQRAGAFALSELLAEEECAREALEEGAPSLLTQALDCHPGHADLQASSFKAMQLLSRLQLGEAAAAAPNGSSSQDALPPATSFTLVQRQPGPAAPDARALEGPALLEPVAVGPPATLAQACPAQAAALPPAAATARSPQSDPLGVFRARGLRA